MNVNTPTTCGKYKIIGINKDPVLKGLQINLFNKNNQLFYMLKQIDSSGMLIDGVNDEYNYLYNWIRNPDYILFSSDTPCKQYGQFNRYDLIKAISELGSKILSSNLDAASKQAILRIVDRLLNKSDGEEGAAAIKNGLRDLDEALKELDSQIYSDIFAALNEIHRIASNQVFSDVVYGKYLIEEHKIVLFLNNILGKPTGNELFVANELYDSHSAINKDIERTYVHETFHFIHFCQDFGVSNDDYCDKVVIEGLAKYFEIRYSEQHLGTNAAKELKLLKEDYSVVSYPYCGACYFERYESKNVFGEVVDASMCAAPHLAFHILLQGTKELEIIIKNL